MSYWKKNDFEREGGTLIRGGNQSNVKRESKIYIIDKKGNEEDGVRKEKHIVLGLNIN